MGSNRHLRRSGNGQYRASINRPVIHDISPLISSPVQVDSELGDHHHKLTKELREHFVNIDVDTDDSNSENEEWVDESGVDFNRNAFDIIIDY